MTFIHQRSWRERLFSLPWHPWIHQRPETPIEALSHFEIRVSDTHERMTQPARTHVCESEQRRRDMRAAERMAGMIEPGLRVPLDRK